MDAMSRHLPADETILYADDSATHADSVAKLQENLRGLELFAAEVGLEIHPEKSCLLALRSGGRLPALPEVTLAGATVPFSGEGEYLGVTIQQCGGIGSHLEKVIARADGIAARTAGTLRQLRPSTAIANHVFRSKVLPTLTYGIGMWGQKMSKNQAASLDAVQARFIRQVYSLPGKLATEIVFWLAQSTRFSDSLPVDRRPDPAPLNIPVDFVRPNDVRDLHDAGYFLLRGLHDRACLTPGCWRPKTWDEPEVEHTCRFCAGSCTAKFHLSSCPFFAGREWFDITKELASTTA